MEKESDIKTIAITILAICAVLEANWFWEDLKTAFEEV